MNSSPSGAVAGTVTVFVWLAELVKEYGPGEYILNVRADGSATVKRPRPPLKFEFTNGRN